MAQRKLRSDYCACGHDRDYHQSDMKTRFREDAKCGGSQRCGCKGWVDKLDEIDPEIVALTMPQLRRELVSMATRQTDIEYVLEAKTRWEERSCSCGKKQTR